MRPSAKAPAKILLRNYLPRTAGYLAAYQRMQNGLTAEHVTRITKRWYTSEGAFLPLRTTDFTEILNAIRPDRRQPAGQQPGARRIVLPRGVRIAPLRFEPPLPLWPAELRTGQPQRARCRVLLLNWDGSVYATGKLERTVTFEGFETTSVPAGTFHDCARIHCITRVSFRFIWVTAEEYFWLHPQAGIVRHAERLDMLLLFLPITHWGLYELVSFQPLRGPEGTAAAGQGPSWPLTGSVANTVIAAGGLPLKIFGLYATFVDRTLGVKYQPSVRMRRSNPQPVLLRTSRK